MLFRLLCSFFINCTEFVVSISLYGVKFIRCFMFLSAHTTFFFPVFAILNRKKNINEMESRVIVSNAAESRLLEYFSNDFRALTTRTILNFKRQETIESWLTPCIRVPRSSRSSVCQTARPESWLSSSSLFLRCCEYWRAFAHEFIWPF